MREETLSRVDLTNCDREPIQIPGAIQPHGVLLALREPDLTIWHASASAALHLDREPERLLGKPLRDAIDIDSSEAVRAALASRRPTDENPLDVSAGEARFDAIVHRHDGIAILELEPPPAQANETVRYEPLRLALGNLEDAENLDELCNAVVQTVKRLTGFERVMLYRFDEDGHGSVESEAKEDSLDPYLGLHYPASDIPRQARELYRRNWLRIIPDARYTPSPILPPSRPDTGTALDLSFAVLRSVSPIHLEYLANMGVRASMSISLVVRDRLWGLISCLNHTAPRFVGFGTRSACEAIGRLVSLQIAALDERERAVQSVARRSSREALADAMSHAPSDEDLLDSLVSQPDPLLALVGASGAAVIGDGAPRTCGQTPPDSRLAEIAQWLSDSGERAPFATSSLAAAFPSALAVKDVASGLLTVALPGTPRRRVIWFRPEMIHAVFWGGDPRKPAEIDRDTRLHPRRSFEKWKEEIRLRASPWSLSDLDAAEELRRRAIELDLERQLVRAEQAVRLRDDLVAVVSHDLKNMLHVTQMQTSLLMELSPEGEETRYVRDAAERIQRNVEQMHALSANLLDHAKIQSGQLKLEPRRHHLPDLVEESVAMVRPLADAKRIAIVAAHHDVCSVNVDRDRVFQVIANIVGNAIKFTPHGGRVTVESKRVDAELWVGIADTGPGIPEEARQQVFDQYWHASGSAGRAGSGLGLYIAKSIVEAHGGRIWVEQSPSGGASFTFAIPCSD